MSIDIIYENGQITIKNNLNHRNEPVTLTSEEAPAVAIIYTALSDMDFDLNNVHLERRTDNYLSIVLFKDCDFCRVKIGPKAKWFSLFFSVNDNKLFTNDPRLIDVKNKNQSHWKIKISDIEDIKNYSDLIQNSCRIFTPKQES